jgi:hypothetical protein
MENHKVTNNYSSYYTIPALICGIFTAWVITGSIGYMILGALLGLLAAAIWMNAVVKRDEEV